MKTDKIIPALPTACTCGNPVCVNRVRVQHINSGKFREGVFSQFGQQGKAGKLVIKPEYRFIAWLPQCVECMYHQPQEELLA